MTNILTDTHYYDSQIREIFKNIIINLEDINRETEDTIWNQILQYPKDYYVQNGLLILWQNDCVDNNVGYRPRKLVAQMWLKISNNEDLIQEYFQQIRDMLDTNGTCPQGRTNRCIQILQCCK